MNKFFYFMSLFVLAGCASGVDTRVIHSIHDSEGKADVSLLSSPELIQNQGLAHIRIPAVPIDTTKCSYTDGLFQRHGMTLFDGVLLWYTGIWAVNRIWTQSPENMSYSAYTVTDNGKTQFDIFLRNDEPPLAAEEHCLLYSKSAFSLGDYYKEINSEFNNVMVTLDSIGVKKVDNMLEMTLKD